MNLKPIEKKLSELERKSKPDIIHVWLIDEEAGTYEHNGTVYTREEYQAMRQDAGTVIHVEYASEQGRAAE